MLSSAAWGCQMQSKKGCKVPHLIQDTNGKVTHSQLDTTNESQEVKFSVGY